MLGLYGVILFTVLSGVSALLPYASAWSVSGGIVQGRITCVEPSGQVWQVASTLNDEGVYSHTDDGDLLKVEIDLEAAARGPVNIKSLTGQYKDIYPYVGVISVFTDDEPLNVGPSIGGLTLGATPSTDPSARPTAHNCSSSDIHGVTYFVESAVWHYEPETKFLRPQWVNLDGSIPDIRVLYVPEWNVFAMKGAPISSRDNQTRECRFTFNPL